MTTLHYTERQFDPYIESYVPQRARVIDLGCGDGQLLERLIASREIFARGVEISPIDIKACIAKGLSVYQGDLDDGFQDFDQGAFDVVILNDTLSMLYAPDHVLTEIVRFGKQAIITFYNTAYLPNRQRFLEHGNLSALLPNRETWYRSNHIRPFSIIDFEQLCAERRIKVRDKTIVDRQFQPLIEPQIQEPQTWGFAAIYLIERA